MRGSGSGQEFPVRSERFKRVAHQYLEKQRRRAEVRSETVAGTIGGRGGKTRRRRTEKREYGLFRVSKVNAHAPFSGQALDDAPLERIQILHFVNLNPVKTPFFRQRMLLLKKIRLVQQVVEVNTTEFPLEPRIRARHRIDNSFCDETDDLMRQWSGQGGRNADPALVGHEHPREDFRIRVPSALERIGNVVFKYVVQIGNPLRIELVQPAPTVIRGRTAHAADAAQDGHAVRPPDIGWCACAQFSPEHVQNLMYEFRLLHFVYHMLSRMHPPDRD